jgi:predicted amidohydrolase
MRLEANHQEAVRHIRDVASQGACLAVLPEYHLLNWVPKDPGFKDACSHWETYLTNYRDLAKELNINIVPGTILELHDAGTPEEVLLNVAYFIDNTGAIAGRYVKKNLWGAIERDHLTSSAMEEHPVFDTPLGKVGMLICWDLAFPEAWRELIAQGAKMVIIPTFWTLFDCSEKGLAINPRAEALFLDSVLTARCFENTCGEYSSFRSRRRQTLTHT